MLRFFRISKLLLPIDIDNMWRRCPKSRNDHLYREVRLFGILVFSQYIRD